VATDRSVPIGFLHELADAMARCGDSRFTTLLAAWAQRLEQTGPRLSDLDDGHERSRAAEIIAAPESVLGRGLHASRVADPARTLSQCSSALWSMFESDHPDAVDSTVGLLRDLENCEQDPDLATTRTIAVNVLSHEGNPIAAPCLADRIRARRTDKYSRSEAVKALAALPGQGAVEQLTKLGTRPRR
jgi:hypothetical protein